MSDTNNAVSAGYPLRSPCPRCGYGLGRLTQTGGQNVIRCVECETWCYNAPRVETGEKQHSVTTIHAAVRPKMRAFVLMRDGGRCLLCGADGSTTILHVDHILSVADGLDAGLTELVLNSESNLMTLCEVCNLGKGRGSLPLPLLIALLSRVRLQK